jgi:hypothetical protein
MRESEKRQKLVNYIKRNLKKGYTIEALRWALINQDYSKVLVEKAIQEANEELAQKAPILEDKPKITYNIIDENNQPVKIKKSWWKKLLD